jgi:hypothetical protein
VCHLYWLTAALAASVVHFGLAGESVYGILGDREKHSKEDEEFSTSIVEGLSGYVGVLHHGAFTVRGATLRGVARNRGQRAMIWFLCFVKKK